VLLPLRAAVPDIVLEVEVEPAVIAAEPVVEPVAVVEPVVEPVVALVPAVALLSCSMMTSWLCAAAPANKTTPNDNKLIFFFSMATSSLFVFRREFTIIIFVAARSVAACKCKSQAALSLPIQEAQ
jgi:hypothetical protein